MKNGAEENRFELCSISLSEWRQHQHDLATAVENLIGLTKAMNKIEGHTECLPQATQILAEIRNELVAAATGKDHVPLKVYLVTTLSLAICFLFCMAVMSQTDFNTPWVTTKHRHSDQQESPK